MTLVPLIYLGLNVSAVIHGVNPGSAVGINGFTRRGGVMVATIQKGLADRIGL